jgi:hypothetical protein
VSHRAEAAEAAARMRDEALEGFRSALGEDHPGTVAAREWQRVDQDIAPFTI